MTTTASIVDVAIAGGGPAGVMCACELLAQGYTVAILDAGQTATRIEGLSPRAVGLLIRKGMQSALQAVSPRLSRQVNWGEWGEPNEPSADSSGAASTTTPGEHLVKRPQFDHLLREIAIERGAIWLQRKVSSIERSAQGYLQLTDEADALQARFVLDARGRRANRVPTGWSAPRNLALAGFVSGLTVKAGSAIQSLPSGGWLWMARHKPQAPVWAQLLLDAHTYSSSEQTATAALQAAIQQCLPDSQPDIHGEVLIRAADFRLNTHWHLKDNCLPVGDACAAFDPLSGHGLFWAFSSALSAAAIAHTLLQDSTESKRLLCERFYRERMSDTIWRQARVGRDFYALSGQDGDFWQQRAQWPDALPPDQPTVTKPCIEYGPAIQQGQVTHTERLRIPSEPGPLAWFGAIPLVAALRRYQECTRKGYPSGAEMFHRECTPQVSQTEAAQCWNWLNKHHILDDFTLFESGDRGDYVNTVKPTEHRTGHSAGGVAA